MKEKMMIKIIDEMSDLLIVFNKNDGQILFVNKSSKETFQYDKYDSLNIKVLFPEIFDKWNEIIKCNDKKGESYNIQGYRKNHTCFPINIKLKQIESEDMSEDIYACIGENVLEKNMLMNTVEQSQQETRQALKVKSDFVATITHELRTPVIVTLGNIQELMTKETDPKKMTLLKLIERNCNDQNTLINSILDFSKFESGKFTLEKRPMDLYAMIDYIKDSHKAKLNEKGLDFTVTIGQDVPRKLVGDELRLQQILNNLIANAIKFTSVGRISLEVVLTAKKMDKAELFFIVMDTGIGIDKESKDRIFESFQQADNSISRQYGGTGLGLNISKQLVEMMGGKIDVESQVNKGSMFHFNVWLDLPEEDKHEKPIANKDKQVDVTDILKSKQQMQDDLTVFEYGTKENQVELKKIVQKLVIAMEMENWKKAESFADGLKQMTTDAPKEIKQCVLKLKMAVQKANIENAIDTCEKLAKIVEGGVNNNGDKQ